MAITATFGIMVSVAALVLWLRHARKRADVPSRSQTAGNHNERRNSSSDLAKLIVAEAKQWIASITIDDPHDERSALPPGHRIVALAAELAAIAKAAGDDETSRSLWDAADTYNKVHLAAIDEIKRYARLAPGVLANNLEHGATIETDRGSLSSTDAINPAVVSHVRGEALASLEALSASYETYCAVYRRALEKHGATTTA